MLIIMVPNPRRRLQSSFAIGLSQSNYGLSLRTQGGEIPLLLEELQAKFSEHLSLLDLTYRAELGSRGGGCSPKFNPVMIYLVTGSR